MNNITKNFLEKELREALLQPFLEPVKTTLGLLGRRLTLEEKELFIKTSRKQNTTFQIEAIKFTALRKYLTNELIIEHAKNPVYTSQVLEFKPATPTIETIIKYFIDKGEIFIAQNYAEFIKRPLSKKELLHCADCFSKQDTHPNGIGAEIARLLGKKKLPRKYRDVIIDNAIRNNIYHEFREYGGISKNTPEVWFRKTIDGLIKNNHPGDALLILINEKLFHLSNIQKLFKHIAQKGYTGITTRKRLFYFFSICPKKVRSECYATILTYGGDTPCELIETFGGSTNNKILAVFMKRLKGGKIDHMIESFMMDTKMLHRKLNHQEMEIVLMSFARNGDLKGFFRTAKKYSFEPTAKMLRVLEKNT